MKLRLERRFLGDTYTIGKLFIDGKYFCDTLEDKVRDYNKDGDLLDEGETKVFGETAVPYGTHRVILSESPRFKRLLPEILDVLHFTSIRIHAGVTNKHTEGCILVGKNKIKGQLSYSRKTENELVAILQSAKDDIYIEIT